MGHIYVYSWPAAPGFVKIGYAKDSVAERGKQWAKCHVGARIDFTVEVPCSERMEGLVHAQMGGQRYGIALCAVCQKRHTEIFKDPDMSARSIIQQWCDVVHTRQLYTVEKQLSKFWVDNIANIPVEGAAESLAVLAWDDQGQLPKSTNEVDDHWRTKPTARQLAIDPDSVDQLVERIARGLDLRSV